MRGRVCRRRCQPRRRFQAAVPKKRVLQDRLRPGNRCVPLRLAFYCCDQLEDGGATHLPQGHAHSGKRRVQLLGEPSVVESNDRHVFGDRKPRLEDPAEGPDRSVEVCHKDGSWARPSVKEGGHRTPPSVGLPAAAHGPLVAHAKLASRSEDRYARRRWVER